MVHVLLFFGGLITGCIVASFQYALKSQTGTLLVDQSDSEKDIYKIIINRLDDLYKNKYVILKVDKYADTSKFPRE